MREITAICGYIVCTVSLCMLLSDAVKAASGPACTAERTLCDTEQCEVPCDCEEPRFVVFPCSTFVKVVFRRKFFQVLDSIENSFSGSNSCSYLHLMINESG